jgi:photosystem II stability/assembly factor-like uncharacterized protein
LFRWCGVIIIIAFLASCSPPQTYPLFDSNDVAGSSQPADPSNPHGNLQNNKSNAQPLWISDLRMFDSQDGWALDDLGRILMTREGAALWKDVSPAQPDPKTYITTAFLTINRAVVVYYTPDNDKFESWITEDGGSTWLKGSPLPDGSPGMFTPVQLFFLNTQKGWFAGLLNLGLGSVQTVIYVTIDGGFSWELAHLSLPENGTEQEGNLPGSLILPDRNLLFFTDTTRGFAGNGSLYQTVDEGRNWNQVVLNPPDETLVAENSFVYITSPTFHTFSEGVLMMTGFSSQLDNTSGDEMAVSPTANFLFFTFDGGNTWEGKEAPALIGMNSFISPESGWFLGKDDPAPNVLPKLYKTLDGGETWNLVNEALPLPLGTRLEFINEFEGFAFNLFASRQENIYNHFDERAGTEPYLFQTVDGGYTWEEVEPYLILKNEKPPKQP